jgi:phospholipid/cholesterol/gamma-HCH transport system permease protein
MDLQSVPSAELHSTASEAAKKISAGRTGQPPLPRLRRAGSPVFRIAASIERFDGAQIADHRSARIMVRFFNALGAPLLSFFQYLGELVLLAADTFRSIFTHKLRWKLFLNQVVEIGLLSQLVVIITGAFTGAVFSAQTFFQFNKLGMGSAVGAVVSVSLCRELAPVLTALMVAGRVGAAMSAEIGTMKVTEQIDALRALAVYPVDYLVVPRALAMMVSMPLLVAECIAVGIGAGYLVAIFMLDINGTYYMANMVRWTRSRDIIMGLSKAFCFGILIVFISCQKGLTTSEGAVGVGRATTEAVVNSSLAVLICNFFLTMMFNIIYPAGYQ